MKLVFLTVLFSIFANANALKYPKVVGWQNQPIIEFINNRQATLQKDLDLKNSFVVVTGVNDEAYLQFTRGESVTVLEKTRIQVPQVSPDTGEAPELFIFDGVIRYQSTGKVTAESKLHIKSGFFDLILPIGIDVVITIDKNKPSAKFQVVTGEMTAVFLDFEKQENLKAGEMVVFEGEKDEVGQVKYDYFLQSKRMPHGTLKDKEKFDTAAFLEKEKVVQAARAAEKAKVKAVADAKAKKNKLILGSFLCHEPLGQKNECYWIKKGDDCFRYRCNVSGQWGDQTERPMTSKCLAKPASSACDY